MQQPSRGILKGAQWTSAVVGLILVIAAGPAHAEHEKDFGFRIQGGSESGIGPSSHWEVGAESDFYFLSDSVRMSLGVNFLLPQGLDIPLTAVEFVGLEGVIPAGSGDLIVGMRFFKPYLQEAKNGLHGNKGLALYGGYKIPIQKFADWIVTAGWMNQPFTQSPADPAFPLSANTFFIRTGYEWYF